MENDRIFLNRNKVDELLKPGEFVHTFVQAGPVLVGADWKRSELLEMVEKNTAELSGDQASSMHHGVVIWNGKQPVFCETVQKDKGV